MRVLSPNLGRFVRDTEQVIAQARGERPVTELRSMMKDAPAVRPLERILREDGFGLIAEIKEKSPSQGEMDAENVQAAVAAYRDSEVVRGISVLTNRTFFGNGMTLDRLRKIKIETGKPVLRKDFVIEAYQVYEARAYGADAILLMANILERDEMQRLFDVARELEMDVLFETHTPEEITDIPDGARIFGINCRNFDQSPGRYWISRSLVRLSRWIGGRRDLSVDYGRFSYANRVPVGALKIAESGVGPAQCGAIRQAGFDAVLVGTSLLIGPARLSFVLAQFEEAILGERGRQGSEES